MSSQVAAPFPPAPIPGKAPVVLALAASLALHAALFAALVRVRPPVEHRSTPISIEIVETVRPPPPPAPAAPQAPSRPPEPRAVRAPRPPPRRPAVVREAPPAPAPPAPPPPNAPAPIEAEPAPPRIGVSMSSTTEAGSTAAPTGNTVYGKAPPQAGDPSQARPYRADRYAAPSEVSSLPVPIQVELPRSEYPPYALREGFEGTVRLRLLVDEEGRVREATVVSEPGHGLGAAAARAAKRWFRFRPAQKGGAAIATEIPFTVRFELE